MTNFELYELLKEKLGEEAARKLAEMPQVQDLATKQDLDRHHLATQADLERFRAEVRAEIERHGTELRAEIERHGTKLGTEIQRQNGRIDSLEAAMRSGFDMQGERLESAVRELRLFVLEQVKSTQVSTLRWMLTLFVPVWLGVAGMVVAILVKL